MGFILLSIYLPLINLACEMQTNARELKFNFQPSQQASLGVSIQECLFALQIHFLILCNVVYSHATCFLRETECFQSLTQGNTSAGTVQSLGSWILGVASLHSACLLEQLGSLRFQTLCHMAYRITLHISQCQQPQSTLQNGIRKTLAHDGLWTAYCSGGDFDNDGK